MTRILKLIVMSAIVTTALALSALPGIAAPPTCEENPNGCKSVVGEESTTTITPKNNPKFNEVVVTEDTTKQRGNFNSGTDDATLTSTTTQAEVSCQNPSGKPQGPTCR
jgi:hypothetical protein